MSGCVANGAEPIDFVLELGEVSAELLLGVLVGFLFGFNLLGDALELGLELFDAFHDLEPILFDFALVDFLGVDFGEEGLIFLVVLGVLLLGAEFFDAGFAGFHLQVELAALGLLLAELLVGEFLLFGEIGDSAFLDADAAGGAVEAALSGAKGLIGLINFDQRDVGRTHRDVPSERTAGLRKRDSGIRRRRND